MKKRLLLLSFLLSFTTTGAFAQTVVWSKDIAPILFNNCATCHRTGGIAPFELTSYPNAQLYALSMKRATADRSMPPWPPDAGFSRLAHERLLSQQDIDKIAAWANDGAPKGDPSLAPPLPVFSDNGDIPGTPDLIARVPNYTSVANSGDVYQCFVIPSGLSVDKYISGFEALPGNRKIVHHVLVYADTTGTCKALDNATPAPGYINFGGVGTDKAIMLGGWVPGTAPLQYPTGFGVMLPKNADIVVQIHYPGGTVGQVDSTKIRFFFSSAPSVRNVRLDPILNHYTNTTPALFIPANSVKTFTQQQVVPFNGTLLGIAPHMHLLGRNITVYGTSLTGDTAKYIRINNWDFHWQGFYLLRQLMKIPAGTTLRAQALYDNTNANPANPNSPPKDVSVGEQTTDEMMVNYFIWTTYQAGDENIIIDNKPLVTVGINKATYYDKYELFTPYPNPANGQVYVKFFTQAADKISLSLYDINGRVIRQWARDEQIEQGYQVRKFDIKDLVPGIYTIQLQTTERTLTQKLIIQ